MVKRVSSCCMAFFIFIFCSIPVSASSSSEVAYEQPVTASGAVGGTIALSGYLSASGIHLSAAGSSFSDVELELGSLWDTYKATVQGIKNLAEYTGSVVRGGYVLAKNTWNAFGGFSRWLIDKFNLTDNQENVNLTENLGGTSLLSTAYKTSIGNGYIPFSSRNIPFSDGYLQLQGITNSSLYGYYSGPDYYNGYRVCMYNAGSESVTLQGDTVKLYQGDSSYFVSPVAVLPPGKTVQLQVIVDSDFNPAFIKTSGTPSIPPEQPEQSILSVNTGEISVPDDIADDATGNSSLGGIMIPSVGAGVGGAAGAIAAAIINGITDGDLIETVIRAADVALPPDLEVGDDGDIFPDVLEIDPSDIFLESDGQIIGDLFDYFPFSIPKTLYQTLLALDTDPVTPEFQYIIKMPYDIQDIIIDVDFTMFNSVAAILRAGMYLLFCIGWSKFLFEKLG